MSVTNGTCRFCRARIRWNPRTKGWYHLGRRSKWGSAWCEVAWNVPETLAAPEAS